MQRHLESVSHTAHKQAYGSDRKLPVKQSYTSSTDFTCLACKKRGHQIHTYVYTVFKGWTLVDRVSVVRELGLWMNCLKRAHTVAKQCRAPPMCKKCRKHYHMLLHRDANYLSQRKPENEEGNMEETHVAALNKCYKRHSRWKSPHLMGLALWARALIDPRSSALFIHERLAQHQRLPTGNKNMSVQGVAGTSMPTQDQYGSMCWA